MSTVLNETEGFAMADMDDILVFSETPKEHFDRIQRVLNRLRRNGLKLKLPKCQFLKEESVYLSFVIRMGLSLIWT